MEDQKSTEGSKAKMPEAKDVKQIVGNLWNFLKDLTNIHDETDKKATLLHIKEDIPFKGHVVWILICSTFIASFGLNANSEAVVIGAMLISPLLGPILGAGLSLAINDLYMMKKSLGNFGVMIAVSVITAFLFFYFFPLKQESSQLLARTSPDIRDVFIAFFGGIALVLAKSKKGTMSSVVFGVAIATALMPPLCTAGYGLAIGNLSYFLGAMYLFTINSIFIAFATFLVIKYLGFSMVNQSNSIKQRRIAQMVSLFALAIIIPSLFTFINLYKKTSFETDVAQYIAREIESNNKLKLFDYQYNFEEKHLKLEFLNELSEATQNDLLNELQDYKYLQDITLEFEGGDFKSFEVISGAYEDARTRLHEKNQIIDALNNEVTQLRQKLEKESGEKTISWLSISKEAKIRFSELDQLTYSQLVRSNFLKTDTMPLVFVSFKEGMDTIKMIQEKQLLKKWLLKEMGVDSILLQDQKFIISN